MNILTKRGAQPGDRQHNRWRPGCGLPRAGRRIRPPQFDALPPEFRELGPSYRAGNAAGTQRWVELEKMSRPPGPPAPPQSLRNRITFALLETIKAPTLLLTGDADLYAPPPILRLFAARIEGSESSIVPEAGHSTY
jgi:pimeloyl-ACP methyl ester carboxylesterase